MSEKPVSHGADWALAHGAPTPLDAERVNAFINHRMLVEVVQSLGGEVVLEPGFRERVSQQDLTISTNFTEDGGYRLRVVETPDAYRTGATRGPGVNCGSRWSRRTTDGDGRGFVAPDGRRLTYEVERVSGKRAELRPLHHGMVIEVEVATLLRGEDGWRREAEPQGERVA